MKRIYIATLLLLYVFPVWSQTRHLLKGIITDRHNRTPMTGATIYSKDHPETGTSADAKGEFSLLLPAGRHTLICTFIGYRRLETEIELNQPEVIQLFMEEDSQTIEEVVVTSRSATERMAGIQIGVEKIEITEMAKIPSLFGERDIIRSIQLLPGIKSEGEGSSGFQVRGGRSAQNLILLDDATVYNTGHLMGIFSTFNDDALTNASLYKGQIPAQFGGATSSVFDIHTKSGDAQKFGVSGSIGLLSAKLNLEGPIIKDKLSFFIAARRTYMDLFLKLSKDYKDNVMNFYDINAKVNYNISDKDKLFVSLFTGMDNMGMDKLMEMQWGNKTSTIRWFHQFNPNLHANTSLIFSSYTSDNSIEILDSHNRLNSYIKQAGLKESLGWTLNDKHSIQAGFQSMFISIKSADWDLNNYREKERRNGWENSAWLNEEWKATEQLSLSAGLRFNAFSALGGSPYYRLDEAGNILETLDYKSNQIAKTHLMVEPRFSMNYRLAGNQSVKAGYSRTSQNIHAIRNEGLSLPFDRYTMSSNLIKPQLADQVSLGYIRLTNDEMYEFSVEGYYKAIQNVLDYKDGKSFSSEVEIERIILPGKGRAYGLEFYARKNAGRLTGWTAYTLSWSENKIPGINQDNWYRAGNDRRHDISIVGMYELKRGWNVAATWVYNTGQALTAPSAKYELNGETVYYYAERNGYRAPAYHRLDLSATHTKKKGRFTREWSFGLYNAYCRYNPFIITFEDDKNKPSGTKTMQRSLFGIIPSVSYNFKF